MLFKPVIGVDLGSQGGAVEVVKTDGQLSICSSICFDLASKKEIAEYFIKRRDRHFLIEEVSESFGDGVKSVFTFGKWVGFVTFLLDALDVKYHLISPIKWSSYYRGLFKNSINSDVENKLRNELWVKVHFNDICNFAKKKIRYHSGIIDGFLIANYFIEKHDTILKEGKEKEKKKRSTKPKAPKASFI